MLGAGTRSRFAWTCALGVGLALAAATAAPQVRAQPRETVHERRPPVGSLGRGLLPAPRSVVLGAGVAVGVVAGVLLARRARRTPR